MLFRLPFAAVCVLLFTLISAPALRAQMVTEDQNFIRIDQFGYPTNGNKVAIIARAQEGYNAGMGIRLNPGHTVKLMTEDGNMVYEAYAKAWNGGGVDDVSGDAGYWFDFTEYKEPGDYRIQVTMLDGETVESYPFRIADDVYADALRAGMEFFYYQRINQEKTAEYASGEPWTDGAWFDDPDQEYAVKQLDNPENTRSMPKGWFDAGDPNKYVTFATTAVHALLTTYDQYPDFWDDFELRIPEGDNDIPDLLDEIRWETDWLESMQDYDPASEEGSGGFYQKMGILNDHSYISPPSTDDRERWYNQICVNSTITGAGMLAHAAYTYDQADVWPDKVADLRKRAEAAWDFYVAAPNKDEQCDDGRIEAGDADGSGAHYSIEHLAEAAATAAYLFALTGDEKYSTFVQNNYTETRPWKAGAWGIYRSSQAEAMLFYTQLDGTHEPTVEAILAEKTSDDKSEGGDYVVAESDNLYRALPIYFNWGSNSLVSRQASNIMDFLRYDLKEDNHPAYRARAQSIVNYLHGTNPSGICMLSNMYEYGAELCADEMWHSWFALDTKYDNIDGDNVGPAPGFLSGGPNPQGQENMVVKLGTHVFEGATAGRQPDQKAFSVDNHWEYGPWAYNEPAIYYQASYVKALAHFVAAALPDATPGAGMGSVNDCAEAEDIFSVANEAGENSTVGVDENPVGASAGRAVRLFDGEDAATLTFSVAAARTFDLALRVRVGEQSGDDSTALADQYVLTLNGDTMSYRLDPYSMSNLEGDTYWGEIVIEDADLSQGEHELTVMAMRDWLKLDRLCWRDPGSIIDPTVEQTAYLGALVALPGTIQAENYDMGGQGVAYNDSDASNNGGAYRPDEGVDIEGDDESGYSVGWVNQFEWMEYTVNVTTAGAYNVSAALASPDGGGQLYVRTLDNSVFATLEVPEDGTGAFDQFTTVSLDEPINLSEGVHELRLEIGNDVAFNIDSLTFTLDSAANSQSIANYFDGLENADTLFSGEPGGITYELSEGVLVVAGDGTGGSYQSFSYTLPEDKLANAVASNNRLYIGAHTASGEAMNLRVDLVDDQDRHTTIGSVTQEVSGTEMNEVVYVYDDAAYQDGAYGGTGCEPTGTNTTCPVNGTRIHNVVFYPEPIDGGFNDTLYLDHLSFGRSIQDTTGGGDAGMINYADRFEDGEDDFSGEPAGLTFGVEDGIFFIAGDGQAPSYQTIDYRLRMNGEPVLADVAGSNHELYLNARVLGGDTVNLRVDLVDDNDYNTTNGGRNVDIAGSEFRVYTINFEDGYEDGGYGGTGCSSDDAPCEVNAERIAGLRFYPNAVSGGFNDTLQIEWLSFGVDLSTSVRDFAKLDGLTVFPNPTNGAFTVRFGLRRAARVDVQLFDSFGRIVRERGFSALRTGEQSARFDNLNLPTGTYYLRLLVDGKSSRAMPVMVRE